MLSGPLILLPALSLLLLGCTASEGPDEKAREPSLLSQHGRMPLMEREQNEQCRGGARVTSAALEGAPPLPAGAQHEKLPEEEEGGIVYNAAVARALAAIYVNALYDTNLPSRNDPPLRARLEHGIWHLSGPPLPADTIGGEFYIQICQSNGRVLSYIATQ
jgi:hypothetical protein